MYQSREGLQSFAQCTININWVNEMVIEYCLETLSMACLNPHSVWPIWAPVNDNNKTYFKGSS